MRLGSLSKERGWIAAVAIERAADFGGKVEVRERGKAFRLPVLMLYSKVDGRWVFQ